MNEINTGLRSVLKYGWVYRLSQAFLGEKRSKSFLLDNYICDLSAESRVLDMGCGAGNFAYFLPQTTQYFGFDPNQNYIDCANDEFKNDKNRRFFQGTATSQVVKTEIPDSTMDYAIVHGVFHHLSDDEIAQMYEMAQRVLKPGGQFIILEPVWFQGQAPMNKFVMSLDRGKNIKSKTAWLELTKQNTTAWGEFEFGIYDGLIRFYDLIIIRVSKNKLS